MIIGGFKKLHHDKKQNKLCIVISTQGCSFHCSYCFYKNFIEFNEGVYGENEVLRYMVSHRNSIAMVCITGGEPTLQHNLPDFLEKIKKLDISIRIETSGMNSKVIQILIEKKLVDFISMDIKNTWENYSKIIGSEDADVIENCKASLQYIQAVSSISHEFRTTFVPNIHNDEDVLTIAGYLKDKEKYCVQNIRSSDECNEFPEQERGPRHLSALVEKLRTAYPNLEIYER